MKIVLEAFSFRASHSHITLGKDSARPFQSNVRNPESLAAEMAAFANLRCKPTVEAKS